MRGEDSTQVVIVAMSGDVRADGGVGRTGLVEGWSIRIVDILTRGRVQEGNSSSSRNQIDCAKSFHIHAEGISPPRCRGCDPG